MRISIVLFIFCVTLFGTATAQGVSKGHDHSISVRHLGPEVTSRGYDTVPSSLPLPAYPAGMLRAGISGDATLRFLVQEDGSVTSVEVIAASQVEFCIPAKEAVAKWKFRTYTERGDPVQQKVWMRCKMIFKFEED